MFENTPTRKQRGKSQFQKGFDLSAQPLPNIKRERGLFICKSASHAVVKAYEVTAKGF